METEREIAELREKLRQLEEKQQREQLAKQLRKQLAELESGQPIEGDIEQQMPIAPRKRKLNIALICVGALIVLGGIAWVLIELFTPKHVFRNVDWGMTMDEVRLGETAELVDEEYLSLTYEGVSFLGYTSNKAVYTFSDEDYTISSIDVEFTFESESEHIEAYTAFAKHFFPRKRAIYPYAFAKKGPIGFIRYDTQYTIDTQGTEDYRIIISITKSV